MKISIIGAGKVGTSFAIELQEAGYIISSITDKSVIKARKTAKACKCKVALKSFSSEAANKSDLIIISVKDDELKEYYKEVREIDFRGKILVHTSGIHSSEIFRDYKVFAKDTASFHPAQTFPRISYVNGNYLKNIYFAVEGGKRAEGLLSNIARKLHSDTILLSRNKKELFHLSCVVSSNFLAANFYLLENFSKVLGIEEKKLFEVLKPLFTATADNIHKSGVIGNLTGPVLRGDVKTVNSHLDLLHSKFPNFLEYYKSVSRILAEISKKQNKNLNYKKITDILKK